MTKLDQVVYVDNINKTIDQQATTPITNLKIFLRYNLISEEIKNKLRIKIFMTARVQQTVIPPFSGVNSSIISFLLRMFYFLFRFEIYDHHWELMPWKY